MVSKPEPHPYSDKSHWISRLKKLDGEDLRDELIYELHGRLGAFVDLGIDVPADFADLLDLVITICDFEPKMPDPRDLVRLKVELEKEDRDAAILRFGLEFALRLVNLIYALEERPTLGKQENAIAWYLVDNEVYKLADVARHFEIEDSRVRTVWRQKLNRHYFRKHPQTGLIQVKSLQYLPPRS